MKWLLPFIMVILKNLKKEQVTIGLFSVTLVIAVIQVLFFIPLIIEYELTSKTLILPNNLVLLTAYLISPIISCSLISFLFHPKRIVSPFYVQIETFSIIMAIIIYNTSSLNLIVTNQTLLNLGLVFLFSLFAAVIIGYLQLKVVVWIVALNFESVDRKTYRVNKPIDYVLQHLGDDFTKVWGFKKYSDMKGVTLLKMQDDDGRAVVIAIGSQSDKPDETIIATVSFQVSLYGIKKSHKVSTLCKSVINDIKGRVKSKVTKERKSFLDDDFVSSRAYFRALDLTKSKFEIVKEFWDNIPNSFRNLIYVTLGLFLAISFAFNLDFVKMDFNTYVTTATAILVALLIELGIPLIQEIGKKKEQKS